MKCIETTVGPLYQAKALSEILWATHGFGTRGVLLTDYLTHFGLKDGVALRTNQKHGNRVHVLTPFPLACPERSRRVGEGGGEGVLEGDAFVTNSKGVVCFVRTADCVPILLCDPKNCAVGAVHAGWRGHVCDVVGHTVHTMREAFGSDPSGLLAAIGPSICQKCYEVGEDVVEAFKQRGISILRASPLKADEPLDFARDRSRREMGSRRSLPRAKSRGSNNKTNKFFLNLRRASRELLICAGVNRENISTTPLCTSCRNGDFASYRRERAERSRQVNFIYIK